MSAEAVYTLEDLRRWAASGAGCQPPARLAVIGDPIAHSRSPQMHQPALRERGLEMQYVRVHVPAGQVKEALKLFAANDFIGLNCTIPHKFEALEAMDEVDELARKLGAVNTVVIKEGRFIGYNSDGPGFVNSLEEAFGVSLEGLKVLILGAGGGAGQAVALQSVLEGASAVWMANRSVEKLEGLMQRCAELGDGVELFGLGLEEVDEVLAKVDLVVNATPMGMKPGDVEVFDFGRLEARHLVYDMVYRATGTTPLVEAAKAVGAKTCDGLALLLHQGAISFEHWFGGKAPVQVMRAGLLEEG